MNTARKQVRLAALARERGRPGPPSPTEPGDPATAGAAVPAARESLARWVPGREVVNAHGPHWLHHRPMAMDLEPLAVSLTAPGWTDAEADTITALGNRGPGGLLFLDLETCGFAGTPLFLAGVLRVVNGELRAEQLLARDYGEEASVVAGMVRLFGSRPLLVTFNGKSYDLPFLRDRAVRFGLELAEPAGHLDLLHAARRRWKHTLPDCRLQTLEKALHGRHRAHDVPGAEVPERYHRFVAEGAASDIVPILRHNLLDLETLARLLPRLAGTPPTRVNSGGTKG